jgi:hypothetical protein
VLSLGALTTAPARAEPVPLRLHYEAPGGCPGAALFLEEIQWRTDLARVVGPAEAALDVRARIVRRGPVTRGHLVVGEGKDAIVREVEGARCDEVVSALALITALAVDPHASTALKRPAPPAAMPPLPPPPAPGEHVAPALPSAQILGDPLPVIPLAEDAPPAPRPSRWAFGARVATAIAVVPRPLLGGTLFVERALPERWGASVRLAAELTGTGGFDVGPGGAWFLRGVVRAEGCAFAQRATAWLTLVPCLGVEGGVIEAAGILRGSLAVVEQGVVPWVGAGVLPRAAFDLGPVALEVQGGPVFPAVRHTFSFQSPDYLVYALPAVTWTAGLGARVHFP